MHARMNVCVYNIVLYPVQQVGSIPHSSVCALREWNIVMQRVYRNLRLPLEIIKCLWNA